MNTNFDKSTFFSSFETSCCKTTKRSFSKDETITTYIGKRNQICIIIKGEADLIRYDYNGNKTIIGNFIENDIFGEALYPANTNNELFVVAKKDCEILFFIYNDIVERCKQNCPFHKELSKNFPLLLMDKIIKLNTRIELLTKKNIRDKLLSYFDILASKKLNRTFVLPFSLTDLADYLSVDRSAMMRELSHLKEDGIIEKNGNKITLLYS